MAASRAGPSATSWAGLPIGKNTVEIGGAARDVYAAREGLYAEMLQYGAIAPQEVFALTFGISKASRGETEQAMLGGANIGRDADTISSLNGQLCGALNGVDSIPRRWVKGLEASANAPKFNVFAHRLAEPAGLNAGHAGLPMRKNTLETVRGMTNLVWKRLTDMQRQVRELRQLVA